MCVGDGAGQGVGGIGAGFSVQSQQAANHVLNLCFSRMTIADDGLLDLQSRIFGNFKPPSNQGRNGGSAGLSEQERRLRIDVHKDDFNDRLIGLVLGEQFAQAGMDGSQTNGQRSLGIGLDTPAGDVGQFVTGFLDDAEAGNTQSRINSENADRVFLGEAHVFCAEVGRTRSIPSLEQRAALFLGGCRCARSISLRFAPVIYMRMSALPRSAILDSSRKMTCTCARLKATRHFLQLVGNNSLEEVVKEASLNAANIESENHLSQENPNESFTA